MARRKIIILADSMPPITLEEAKALDWRDALYHRYERNSDGTPVRWRVNGKVKTWKRDSNRVRVPVKYGLRACDYVDEDVIARQILSLSEGTPVNE